MSAHKKRVRNNDIRPNCNESVQQTTAVIFSNYTLYTRPDLSGYTCSGILCKTNDEMTHIVVRINGYVHKVLPQSVQWGLGSPSGFMLHGPHTVER